MRLKERGEPTASHPAWYGVLLTVMGLMCIVAPFSAVRGEPQPPMIMLDSAIHFMSPEGQDMVVNPGTYRVEQQGSQLRLTSVEGQGGLVVSATNTTHGESLDAPAALAMVEEGQDDDVHVLLLLPDYTGLEAVGTISGVQKRGTMSKMMAGSQIQRGMEFSPRISNAPSPLTKVPPAVVAAKPTGPTPGRPVSGPGKWVTWNYLFMNHPQIVAQALADVQTGKRPVASISGLASNAELTDLLKTNWGAEVGQMKAARAASMSQRQVASRGLERFQKAPTISHSGSPSLKPSANSLSPVSFPVPLEPKNFGEVFSGQSMSTYVSLTAPDDGNMRVSLNPEALKQRFRIVRANTYTGEFKQGRPLIEKEYRGLELAVKKGQRVIVEVAFEPDPSHGPPAGNYEVFLEIDGIAQAGRRWKRTASLRARCMGIDFTLLAHAEVGHVDTLTEQVVEMPIVITNPQQRSIGGTIAATQLPRGVTMESQGPQRFELANQQTQRYPLRFRVSKAAQEGIGQPIVVTVTGAGVTRYVNLSVTIYHPTVFWCFGYCDGHTYVDIPGIDNRINQNNDQRIWEASVWMRDDGNYGWDVEVGNLNIVDIGGTTYLVTVSFSSGPVVNQLSKNVGPGSETFHFSRGHNWIRDNYLIAAQEGVTLNFCCHDK
jgi:hypothetical protein